MPILALNSLEIISRSPDQTRRIGMRLGAILRPGDVVCLSGDLGAGKTTLVQGIAAGWGSNDLVNSPTFVLVNVYSRPDGVHLYHMDAYRLSGAAEAYDLDLETMIEQGPLVIEWGERIRAALPPERLWLRLNDLEETQRDLLVTADGARPQEMLTFLRKEIYGG